MIIQLCGGLGNQLFQYAFGLALASRNRTPFKLNIAPFQYDSLRTYRLNYFHISAALAKEHEVTQLTRRNLPRPFRGAYWRVQRYLPLRFRTIVHERRFAFDPEMLHAPRACYLIGFWQSYKYFEDIRSLLAQEFQVVSPMGQESKAVANEISTTNSISVHVRRADFVSVPGFNQMHGTCSTEYYALAIAWVKHRIEPPHFFVFSDDMEWARQHLRFDAAVTFVAHNGADRDYEDLRLMSLCKHHIIANSTFSWWGAWLAANPNKLVVAPRKWFNDAAIPTGDLFPASWVRL